MNSGFEKRQSAEGVPFYICRALERISGVRHGFSTRHGGVSRPSGNALNLTALSWDSAEAVAENRRRLTEALDIDALRLITLSQVHSDDVTIIEEMPPEGNERPRADALATRLTGLALAVQVADCFPLLLADASGGAVAAVHAGWRGTLKRIAQKTVALMQTRFGTEPSRVVAAIGPGIRSCCFEVGPEVAAQFDESFPGLALHSLSPANPGRAMLDLRRALEVQLVDAGLKFTGIFDLGTCTRCNAGEFFSFRAEGATSGRMMAIIGRRARAADAVSR